MGDIRTRKINQKHLNNIKMEEKIIYFMCLLMDLSILYEITEIYCIILLSLPSWERGLKSEVFRPHRRTFRVAPFVGAWIEIWETLNKKGFVFVAPFVGAWIEIYLYYYTPQRADMSLPSWERGLKFVQSWQLLRCDCVAPFVGAWIEIKVKKIF